MHGHPAIIQCSQLLRGRQIAIAQTHLPRGALDDIAQAQADGVAEPVAQASDPQGVPRAQPRATKDRHAEGRLPRKNLEGKNLASPVQPKKNANIPSTIVMQISKICGIQRRKLVD